MSTPAWAGVASLTVRPLNVWTSIAEHHATNLAFHPLELIRVVVQVLQDGLDPLVFL